MVLNRIRVTEWHKDSNASWNLSFLLSSSLAPGITTEVAVLGSVSAPVV